MSELMIVLMGAGKNTEDIEADIIGFDKRNSKTIKVMSLLQFVRMVTLLNTNEKYHRQQILDIILKMEDNNFHFFSHNV